MNTHPLLSSLVFALLLGATHPVWAANDHDSWVDLASVPGDENAHHIITEPGSYYLSANLDVTRPTGINIQAAGVTLDLRGFEVRRGSGSGGHGILISATAVECIVRNGSVAGFAYGVRAFSEKGGYSDLTARDCAFAGLVGGDRWIIANCEADDNPGLGIVLGDRNTVIHARPPSRDHVVRGASADLPPSLHF